MYKLEELSIADLKAIMDYGVNIVNNESIAGRGDEYDYWIDTSIEVEKILSSRIKQIFKP